MDFENTRTVLGFNTGPVRSAVKGALSSKGFRSLIELSTLLDLHDTIAMDRADLIVTTMRLGHDDVTPLLLDMRHHRLGTNPFVVVIALLESPQKEDLHRLVNAGVDDVLLMPISPTQLLTRIETIKRARKQFIFTHDYVGPDRRKADRPQVGQQPFMFDPPNPLKLREEPLIDESRYKGLIRNGLAVYRRFFLAVQARQLEWLSDQVSIGRRDPQIPDKDMATNLARLTHMAQDLSKRLNAEEQSEPFKLVTELVDVAHEVADDMRTAPILKFSRMTETATMLRALLAPPNLAAPPPASKKWS